jgi:hypothetical protein
MPRSFHTLVAPIFTVKIHHFPKLEDPVKTKKNLTILISVYLRLTVGD